MKRDDKLFYNTVREFLSEDQVKVDEPLKAYTSFNIGGPCDYFIEPKSVEEIQKVLKAAYDCGMPVFVLGNGSNLLVTDKGYRGAVVHLYNNFNSIELEGDRICAKTGISLATLAGAAAKANLKGLEFASGIPGTLGGAVYMNAGAYGGEMKQVVIKVLACNMRGQLRTFSLEDLGFAYRHSNLQVGEYIALEVEMELSHGLESEIRETMKELNMRRKDKQPLEFPSAGSTFKRPEGYYAGKLIMDAGLRGYHIGDAQVSEKHCGFVVNKGNASFEDVYRLIQYIKAQVREQFGVELEREVKILGDM